MGHRHLPRGWLFRCLLILASGATSFFPPQGVVFAAANLTISPITWNVIGLDSNNVNVGPNHFPVGARVCNTGDATATNVVATFNWDSSNSNINIRAGTSSTLSVSSLAAGSCTDFYFEVEITRTPAAYDTTRDYHISVTADGGLSASTATPRTLYVEHLVSQSRNAVTDVQYGTSLGSLASVPGGGTMTLVVGNTYYIKLVGYTATNGYEQLESFINFPNTIFQVLSVSTTYTADTSAYVSSPNDKAYGDGCKWENDPASPNYRTCLDVGKVGGNITVTYQVKILQVPSSPLANPEPLGTLIYDFSGSSYHYNSDYSVSTRYANIVNASLTKSFSPKTINPGGTSTLTFTITNPGTNSISSVNFTDNLPSNVTISSTTVTYSGCGNAAPASLTVGATSLSFSNITVGELGTCTIGVSVTSSTNGIYNNTTGHLLIGTTDTGSSGSDTLVVSSQPAPPSSCTTPTTIATWTMPTSGQGSGGPPPPYTTKVSDVSSATASATLTGAGSQSIVATGNPTNAWNISDAWPSAAGAPGATTAPYFDFVIDTSNYGGVRITFDRDLEAPGDWGNATNAVYVYSSADGGAFSSATTIVTPKGSWQTGATATAATTGSSTTRFTIHADTRNSAKSTSSVYLDNIVFTGCPRPTVPTLSKSFSPVSVATGITSTLSFTLNNPNTTTSLTGVSFSDVLPAGLTVSSASSSACSGGTLTTTSPRTISLSGGTIAPSGSCTINVTVTGATAGAYTNVSSSVSSSETGPNTTGGANVGYGQSSLTVVDPPVIVKSFTANPIFTNNTTTLSFTITNPNTVVALSGVNFSDSLPAGLVVANPNGLSSTCGGTATATAGSSTVSLSAVSLAASSSCILSVDVRGTTAGLKNNSVTVSSTNGGTGNTSTASVLVKDPAPLISLLKQVGSTASGPWTSFLAVSTGANVYYKFTVENVGDVALSAVNVTDPNVSLTGCTWTDGDGTVLTAPFALPVADASDDQIATCVLGPISAASGSHPNTATASGTYSSTTVTDTSTATYGTTGLTLAKSVTESYFITAGDLLHYSYLVTNSGAAPLLGPVTVSDDKATVTCPAVSTVGDGDAWLDVGESLTCTATYATVAGDVTAGSVTNTASAAAGGVTSNTDSKTVSVPSDLVITKTDNTSGSVAVGNPFNWTITTSNTGATGIATFATTEVIVSDTLPGAAGYYPQGVLSVTNGGTPPTGTIDCSISGTALSCVANGTVSMPAGASFSVTFAVTPTAAGGLANTATVDPNGNVTETNEANNTGSDTVTVVAPPSISKNFSPDPILVNGTTTLTFTITNPNTATALTGVGFTDALPSGLQVAVTPNASTSVDCGSPTFSPASGDATLIFSGATLPASGVCTISVSVTATTAGVKSNTTGNVTSTNGGSGNTASDSLTVNPLIDVSLDKQVDNATPDVGSTVTFTLVVANDGPSTATNVVVTDVVPSGYTYVASSIAGGDSRNDANPSTTGLTWTINSLANGASVNLTYQATVLATGTYDNYAEITSHTETDSDSTPGNSSTTEDDDDIVIVTPTPVADLAITKTDGVTSVGAGGTTTYTVRVTNNGPSAVTGAILSDPAATGLSKTAVTCSPTPGQCLAPPTVAQLESGTFALPALANGAFYEIRVSADVTASSGSVTNTATVAPPAGTTDSNNTNNSAIDTDTVNSAPAMTVSKSSTTASLNAPGTVTYSYLVTNTGNVPLTGISLSDDNDNNDMSCPASSLAVSANMTCTATHTFTQAELDAGGSPTPGSGNLTNNVTAISNEAADATDSLDIPIVQNPSFTIAKSITSSGPYDSAGDIIAYQVLVTNTGNETLTGVSVNDPLLANLDCDGTLGAPYVASGLTINVSAGLTCTGSYALTQADLNNNGGGDGDIDNTVTGDTDQTTSQTSSAAAPLTSAPSMTVAKSSTTASLSAPGAVAYSYLVTNTGNVTLTGIGLSDDNDNNDMSCPASSLAVGGTMTCSATHTFSQAELDANGSPTAASGNLTNNVTASSNEAPDSSDNLDIPIVQSPGLALTKVYNGYTDNDISTTLTAGDDLNFTITMTNTGNTTLTTVVVSDANLTPNSASCASVIPGGTCVLNGSHTVTQADVDAGSFTNTGSVTDDDVCPAAGAGTCEDTVVTPIPQNPAITVTKTIANVSFVTPTVITLTYSILVQNTGDTDLNSVQVVDDLTATFPPPATYVVNSVSSLTFSVNPGFNGNSNKNLLQGSDTLAPGASGAISLVVQVTTNGGEASYTNLATGSGITPGGTRVTASGSVTGPSFIDPALTKLVDPAQAGIGDTVTFIITVTNNGTVQATGVIVTDPLPANLDYVSATSIDSNTSLPRGTVTLIPPRTVQVDIGALDVTDEIVITILATVNSLGQPPVQNQATVVADAPPAGVSPDPTANNTSAVILAITSPGGGGNGGGGSFSSLPRTGFAPDLATRLPPQPAEKSYAAENGVWIEIPRLGVRMPVVGVPLSDGTWDVTWLSDQAGWLEGTAFPTWNGDSVLTGHVYLANGKPGPFVDLHTLTWGDQVIVHAFGERYIYEVREDLTVRPDDLSVIKHETNPWVTLLTCKDYDEATNSYSNRVAVRAVLVKVEEDRAAATRQR
jgi:LPXTG-site transpeptidase (sortase) family protein